MDQISLEDKFLTAGQKFLDEFRTLGFDPEAALWAYDSEVGYPVLLLASDAFDAVGPLVMAEAIFRAYRAALIPPEIDPFHVRLHSPEQTFFRSLAEGRMRDSLGRDQKLVTIVMQNTPLSFRMGWVYKFDLPKKVTTLEATRRWRRFERNLDRAIAA